MKLSLILTCVVVVSLVGFTTAGLLRVPKVYNALITTNEKLVPSRAIPISAPVLHPVGLAPVVPAVVVTSPYIAIEPEAKTNTTDTDSETELKPENEGDKKPEDKANKTFGSLPIPTTFSLPLAYYNSITYYHNLWPYTYSSVSPGSFVFTAPFTYPGIFADLSPSLIPFLPAKKPESDSSASSKASSSSLPEGSKDDPENESVSVEAS